MIKVLRTLATLLGVCVIGAGSLMMTAGSASADSVQTFKNQATKRCLDDSGKGLRTVGCNGKITQKWNVHVRGDKSRQLKSIGTGDCLDDSSKGLRSFGCHPGSSANTKFQSWRVVQFQDGTIRFQNKATARCLDDSSKGLRTFKCHPGSSAASKFQSWF